MHWFLSSPIAIWWWGEKERGMRKARLLGHNEAELLGPLSLGGHPFPHSFPLSVEKGQSNKAGAGAGVPEACVECFVLSFLSRHLCLLSPLYEPFLFH